MGCFSGDRAFDELTMLCSMGPRFIGSSGHRAAGERIVSRLAELGLSVETFEFHVSVGTYDEVGLNIVGRLTSGAQERILLATHWDTHPRSDRDSSQQLRIVPPLGANDGASGTAVLLELASVLGSGRYEMKVDLDFVFFDAEDLGNTPDDACLGSKSYCHDLRTRNERYRFGIVVDMVGGRNLIIRRELWSQMYSAWLNELVWQKAARLGFHSFSPTLGPAVYDDHVPFIQEGMDCILLIDPSYRFWHTVNGHLKIRTFGHEK